MSPTEAIAKAMTSATRKGYEVKSVRITRREAAVRRSTLETLREITPPAKAVEPDGQWIGNHYYSHEYLLST